MATTISQNSPVQLKSLPNFRPVVPGRLYRSSRPDLITEKDFETVQRLGLRCIVDFRSVAEYRSFKGKTKFVDEDFRVVKVKPPTRGDRSNGLRYQYYNNGSHGGTGSNGDVKSKGFHYFINFFTMQYVWRVFTRVPWYMQLYSLMYLLYDLIFWTNYVHFVRFFARNSLNKAGLTSQYVDIVELSQGAIYSALKLLNDSQNLPANLCCAHGKDRTGIVVTMVMGCLGMSRDEIIEEYARSEAGLSPIIDRVEKEVCDRFHMDISFITAKKDTMRGLLEYIDKQYGSIPDYLESIGFSRANQEQLKRNLQA
ncbi:Hypp7682 [Branchiostoma lanceolatum]|uniref:Hypp7682 protein n=1 Tax=Branchiostoma lanceolatum TaxID=7740 RepID=A0A8J9Z2X9_BRALA|nr:Hypp7682 [Branchiostoma lanceolatum]